MLSVNIHRSSCNVPVVLVGFWWNWIFMNRSSKNTRISKSMKIRPVGTELFHADHKNVCFDFLCNFCLKRFSVSEECSEMLSVNIHRSSCNVPVVLVGFWWNWIFMNRSSKNTRISKSMKIRPVGTELFHADRNKCREKSLFAVVRRPLKIMGVWRQGFLRP